MDWQPIDSAPRDGTVVLVFDPRLSTPKFDGSGIAAARYIQPEEGPVSGWWGVSGNGLVATCPTHWMPLPPPPGEAPAADLPVRNERPRE